MRTLIHLIDLQSILLFAVICIPVELLLPLHRRALLRKGWTTDLAYLLFNGFFLRAGLALLIAALTLTVAAGMPRAISSFITAQPVWLQIIAAILIGDFSLYWAHRALHTNRFLWRFHSIHHAVEELDWAAAYHAHPIDEIILAGAAIGSVSILGFSSPAVASYIAVYASMSVAVHVNTRLTLGPLRWIIGSPEFHHWHHSNERDVRDRNFASIISFWDVAFGTVFLPRNRIPQVYGLDAPIPTGYVDQLIHPFRRRSVEPLPTAAIVPVS